MVLDALDLSENAVSKTRRELNDPSGAFLRASVPRVYLYSKTDVMVPWRDVLGHAEEARRVLHATSTATTSSSAGRRHSETFETGSVEHGSMIRTVEFDGSGHVSHITVAEEEYWEAVEKTLAARAT